MGKQNCWDVMACGRQVGGPQVKHLGICPAADDTKADGINGGINGGRHCWAIAGTFCGGRVRGTYAEKQFNCMRCRFFQQVQSEEGKHFVMLREGQHYIRPGGGVWQETPGE